ncbi:MAG: ECF transporter S component [Lachnospiraceae bacterium]|nr:ECF transporter S component [Lachnospiraceae bacterium]
MKNTKAKLTTQTLCFIGLFGALSTVLMLFKLPLPFAPAFMKLDLAELPAILGSFMFGPVAGEFIVIIKLALNLLINGTDSMYVGELSNLVLSSTYVLTASLIYYRRKTKKRAAVSLAVSVLGTSIFAVFSNTVFIFPAYAVVYGLSMDSLVTMAGAVNPFVHDVFTMMLFSVLPFNLVKYGLVAVITFLVYKKLHLFILRILN